MPFGYVPGESLLYEDRNGKNLYQKAAELSWKIEPEVQSHTIQPARALKLRPAPKKRRMSLSKSAHVVLLGDGVARVYSDCGASIFRNEVEVEKWLIQRDRRHAQGDRLFTAATDRMVTTRRSVRKHLLRLSGLCEEEIKHHKLARMRMGSDFALICARLKEATGDDFFVVPHACPTPTRARPTRSSGPRSPRSP